MTPFERISNDYDEIKGSLIDELLQKLKEVERRAKIHFLIYRGLCNIIMQYVIIYDRLLKGEG